MQDPLGTVAHICNPNSGNRDRKDYNLRPTWGKR
jgi:hypothetical protein